MQTELQAIRSTKGYPKAVSQVSSEVRQEEVLSCVAPDTDAGASGAQAILRIQGDKAKVVLVEALNLGSASSTSEVAELLSHELPNVIHGVSIEW